MKRQLRLSGRARRDLEEIWSYTAKRWSIAQAEAYMLSIDSAIVLIDSHPGITRDASAVRAGLLKYEIGSHILYLRLSDDAISIVRILHRSMDPERHF